MSETRPDYLIPYVASQPIPRQNVPVLMIELADHDAFEIASTLALAAGVLRSDATYTLSCDGTGTCWHCRVESTADDCLSGILVIQAAREKARLTR